jgi:hypothetical protein
LAAQSGCNGAVAVGAQVLLNIGTWELTIISDEINTTAFQTPGCWQQHTPTIRHWNGKFAGRFDAADTLGQVALMNAVGSVIVLNLETDTVHKWTGNAVLTGIDPKADVNGVITMDYTYVGNGPCTYS